jgi:hypothetical protein
VSTQRSDHQNFKGELSTQIPETTVTVSILPKHQNTSSVPSSSIPQHCLLLFCQTHFDRRNVSAADPELIPEKNLATASPQILCFPELQK